MAAAVSAGEKAEVFATFGFGSNSVRQLRGRIGDESLCGYPAKIRGQALAFAGPNGSWSYDVAEGGTATLVATSDGVALGTVAFLTKKQLETLDGYEGVPYVYDRRDFKAEVLRNGDWMEMQVIAYIKMNSSDWYPPSEAYRCAVLRNLRGSFPSLHKLVLRDTSGVLKEEWAHPGFADLGTLNAFLFEVGVRKTEPWELPQAIGRTMRNVSEAGIGGTIKDLASALESGSLPFEEEELTIVRRLLAKSTEDEDSDDDAQAERAKGDESLK